MTIGWVYEDDVERFIAATEKPLPPPGPQQLQCPFCAASAATFRELTDHLLASHAARRPVLLIEGREPSHLDNVRAEVVAEGVQLLDCHRIELGVDDTPCAPAERRDVIDLMRKEGSRALTIRLSSIGREGAPGAVEEYRIRVNLPAKEALRRVDAEFVRIFGQGAPHISSIDTFVSRAGGLGADEYVEGLAEYVRGVLIKDGDRQTGVTTGRAEWPEAYKRSLDILLPRARPLPALLCGLMRFALNDFSAWRTSTGFVGLDVALHLLGPLATGVTPASRVPAGRKAKSIGVCPVDAGVSRVLELAARCTGLSRWSVQDQEEMRLLANSTVFSPFDRAKARAVWALTARRLGAEDAAAEPLLALLGNDGFSAWANETLEGTKIG